VLCELEVPALLFAGEHDDERLADSRAAAAAMPHARLEVLRGSDHVTAVSATGAVLSVIKPFLAGFVEPTSASGRSVRDAGQPQNARASPLHAEGAAAPALRLPEA
jgi:hypothetical protein